MALQLSDEIKLVVSDFDGVFTDGSVYISEQNEVQKKLNFKDIQLFMRHWCQLSKNRPHEPGTDSPF